MCVCPAQNSGNHLHESLPSLRCVEVILNLGRIGLTVPGARIRFPRVLVDHFPGKKIEDGVRGYRHFEDHHRGCDAVLPGHFHLTLRARDDLDPWTRKCGLFPVDHVPSRSITNVRF